MKFLYKFLICCIVGSLLIIPSVSAFTKDASYLNSYKSKPYVFSRSDVSSGYSSYGNYAISRPSLSTYYSPTDAYNPSYDPVRESIGERYGLNPIYLYNSSYPGSHSVSNIKISVMLLDGVEQSYIEGALKLINPFWVFEFVPVDPSYFRTEDEDKIICSGARNFEDPHPNEEHPIIVSNDRTVLVICKDESLHGYAYLGPSVYIPYDYLPTAEDVAYVIEHELGHTIGGYDESPCVLNPDYLQNYMDRKETEGKVTINRFTGSGTYSWTVYI